MGDHHPLLRDGPISLPIDFLEVGIIRHRTYSPMGLLTLESFTEIDHDQFLKKVKTVALRQLNEAQLCLPEDIEVFVKIPPTAHNRLVGYIGPIQTPKASDVGRFIDNVRKMNLPLKVEVWSKCDKNSPSHTYQRSTEANFVRSYNNSVLAVEAIEIQDKSPGAKHDVAKDKVHRFSADLVTSQCVRAFRKDLDRRILLAAGIKDASQYKVEIYFKRKVPAGQSATSAKVSKSKDSFEEGVVNCLSRGKPLKVQYQLKATKGKEKEEKKELSSSIKTSTTPFVVPVAEKRTETLPSFGVKSNFGEKPASTAPPLPSVPSIAGFNKFIRSEPMRMAHAGSASSLKTLHDGFYEAVKQATSNAFEPSRQPMGPPPSFSPCPLRAGPPLHTFHFGRSAATEASATKETCPRGFRNDKSLVLTQVEQMLSTFMINLNSTLQDNFGEHASLLSIERIPQSTTQTSTSATEKEVKKEPATAVPAEVTNKAATSSKPTNVHYHRSGVHGARHDAFCNLCNHVIVGTRHKCANCPDWDCCDDCRGKAATAHPGHNLMSIDSTDVIRGSVQPHYWPRHHNILCDGCDSPISGPRFKCIGCADFDWCADCEADPIQKHEMGDHHIFLKINKPLGSSDRVAHMVMQGREIVNEVQGGVGVQQNTTPVADDLVMECKGGSVSLPILTPDRKHSSNADLKRSERTEDDFVEGSENKKTAIEGTLTETIESVQKQLAALSTEAQKLPGADRGQSVIKATTVEVEEEEEEAEAEEQGEEKQDFDMQVINDVNMFDGTLVVAGSQFDKMWIVKNTGRKVWPATTVIRMTSSTNLANKGRTDSTIPRSVQPGDSLLIAVSDLKAGEQKGEQSIFFRLELPGVGRMQGKRFGQQFWCQVTVLDGSGSASANGSSFLSATSEKGAASTVDLGEEQQGQQNGSDHSLGSSLFQLPPKAPESVGGVSDREAATAFITSTVSTTETEDVESVVSFASSEGEDDEEYEIIDPTSEGEDEDEDDDTFL